MTTKARPAKKQTARERYLELARQQAITVVEQLIASPVKEAEPLFDFTAPSGMPFKLRKAKIQQFISAGLLPAHLSAKLYRASQSKNGMEQAATTFTDDEIVQLIEFDAAVVRYVAVDPKIVDDPEAGDEIGYDDITQADFQAIVQWAITGGGEAEKLDSFRQQRPVDAPVGANGTGNAASGKRKAGNK